jgi:hypothetical protein
LATTASEPTWRLDTAQMREEEDEEEEEQEEEEGEGEVFKKV